MTPTAHTPGQQLMSSQNIQVRSGWAPVWAPVLERGPPVSALLAVLGMETLGVGYALADNPLSRGCCQNHDHLHSWGVGVACSKVSFM